MDARQPEAGRADRDALDSRAEAGHRGSGDGVQHPAGGPAALGNNYRALWSAQDPLQRLGVIKSTFDVNKHIEPKHIST